MDSITCGPWPRVDLSSAVTSMSTGVVVVDLDDHRGRPVEFDRRIPEYRRTELAAGIEGLGVRTRDGLRSIHLTSPSGSTRRAASENTSSPCAASV